MYSTSTVFIFSSFVHILCSYHVECDPFLTTTSALLSDALTTRVRAITTRQTERSSDSDLPEDSEPESLWLVGIALGNNAAAEGKDADRTAERIRDMVLRVQSLVSSIESPGDIVHVLSELLVFLRL